MGEGQPGEAERAEVGPLSPGALGQGMWVRL